MIGRIALLALALLAGGCATTGQPGLNATLWQQTSTEHDVLTEQVFRQALVHVDEAMADTHLSALPIQPSLQGFTRLPMAVVLDVDDTVLDNSPYQAMLLKTGKRFPYGWDEWVRRAEAPAVPGVTAFLKALRARRITPIFITNRRCAKRPGLSHPCLQEGDTIRNLLAVGAKGVRGEHVLLRDEEPDWNGEKEIRRTTLLPKYRVIAMIGDDLGDFLPGVKKTDPDSRRKAAKAFDKMWGSRWFMLPNPVYGSWLRVLGDSPKAALQPTEAP